MRSVRRAAILALLLAIAFYARVRLVEERAEGGRLHHQDAPNTFFGIVVFGGFRPIFLEHLWARADALTDEGRLWEVADVFERIERLDPNNPRIAWHSSRTLSFDIGTNEVDAAQRWRWYRRSIRKLGKAIERHPDDFALRELAFWVSYRLIAQDPETDRRCRHEFGRDGLDIAVDLAGALTRDFPDRLFSWECLIWTAQDVARRLLNQRRVDASAKAFGELEKLILEVGERFPDSGYGAEGARSARLWAQQIAVLAAAVDRGDGRRPPRVRDLTALQGFVDALAARIRSADGLHLSPEHTSYDAEVISVIQVLLMQLCQESVVAKSPADALSRLAWVRRILRLTEGRMGPGRPYYSKAYVDRFERFVATDREMWTVLDEGGAPPEALQTRWFEELDELDRELKRRSGRRSDGFRGRLQKARGLER